MQGLAAKGLNLNTELPESPAICIIAVKPQMMGDALPRLQALGGGATVFLSIAAGTTIAAFERVFGADARIIRAMPNTPAAVAHGMGGRRQSADGRGDAARRLKASYPVGGRGPGGPGGTQPQKKVNSE